MVLRSCPHVVAASLTCLLVATVASGQTIWYVDAASPCPGSGTAADPFCTIQSAINAAAAAATPPDEIRVADGIYAGTGNKNLDFSGKQIKLIGVHGPANCIIDCEGSGRGFYFHTGETAASVVDGLTIRNGYVTYSGPGHSCGGGVYCYGSSPTLVNCAIRGNAAVEGLGSGGGVYTKDSDTTLTNCTIRDNSCTHWGAGVYCFGSSQFTNCVIQGNTTTGSDGYGGGVYCAGRASAPVFANCTISGNTAKGTYNAWGGGFCCSSSLPRLTNCTISGNLTSGTDTTGGALCCTSSLSQATLSNCILWADSSPEIDVGVGTAVVTYCDVQGGYDGEGNIDADPLFVDPDGPDNDPNTPADNNYRLSPESPCTDAGNNAVVPPGIATDIEGHPRILDGNCDGSSVVDMGAYEYSLAGDFDYDCAVDVADYWYIHDGLGHCALQQAYQDHVLADLDHDGCITLVDYQHWLTCYRAAHGRSFVPPRLRRTAPADATRVGATDRKGTQSSIGLPSDR
jgi:hypothetical protein